MTNADVTLFPENSVKYEQRRCQTTSCNQCNLKQRPEIAVDIHTIGIFSKQKIQNRCSICLPDNCPVVRHQLGTLCKLMINVLNKMDMY